MPLVITSDTRAAWGGLKKAQGELQGMHRQLSSWGSGQIGQLGGMLGAYFGIDAALNGLRQIKAEADRLQGLARTWSPQVAQAGANADIAEMDRDRAQGLAVADIAARRENLRASEAMLDASPQGLQTSRNVAAVGESLGLGLSAASHSVKAAGSFAVGDLGGAVSETLISTLRTAQMAGIGKMPEGMGSSTVAAVEEGMMAAAVDLLRRIVLTTQGVR